jgi:hypothetical protein
MSNNPKKTGRPELWNVQYFPHFTEHSNELGLMLHKYKSKGYMAYYRLCEALAKADRHKIYLQNDTQKDTFIMNMGVDQEVIDYLIKTMLDNGRMDRDTWENEKAIWIQDFVEKLNPIWYKRGKRLPKKDGTVESIFREQVDNNRGSGTGNSELSKVKLNEMKSSELNDDSLLTFEEYQKLFPDTDINKSLEKLFIRDPNPSHEGVLGWLKNEKNKKKAEFRQTKTGLNIAYCSTCGKKEFPDQFQLKQGSTCHHVEYVTEKPGENVGATNL